MYWCSSAASARADARSCPNGFSTTTRAFSVRPAVVKPFDDRAEEERRDLEVEDRQLRALDRRADPLVGRRVAEVALHVREARGEARRRPCRRAARPFPRSTRARARRSCSTVQSSTATPTIGQSSSPRCSSRYSDRNVITFARSPVIPKITRTSASACCHFSSFWPTMIRPARSWLNPLQVQSTPTSSGPPTPTTA